MKNENKSVGVTMGKVLRGICDFLTVVFCVLRACDVITWQWYWVMSPYFAKQIVCLVALIVAGVLVTIAVEDKDE